MIHTNGIFCNNRFAIREITDLWQVLEINRLAIRESTDLWQFLKLFD